MAGLDFHNHLMPGVDDGAQDVAEATAALRAFRDAGIDTVITTPHVEASLTKRADELDRRLAELDAAFVLLRACATESGIRIERGVELLLDHPEPDLADERLRLAGGTFVLMEFPFMSVPPHSPRAIRAIVARGYTPIIAHPERYRHLSAQIGLVAEWKASGALLQVNGGSLLGRYGREPFEVATQLLERGWVDYLCSDYHARGPALVTDYRTLLERHDAAEQAHTLMAANPARLLDGLRPLPVAPIRLKGQTILQRVASIFRK